MIYGTSSGMSHHAVKKIKSLLHVYSAYRKLDLEVAKILSWSYLTNEKPEIGDWVGLSPQDKIEIVPFFSEEYNEATKFVNYLKNKFPQLELIEYYIHQESKFSFEWIYTIKSGQKKRIVLMEDEKEVLGLIKSAIHVHNFFDY